MTKFVTRDQKMKHIYMLVSLSIYGDIYRKYSAIFGKVKRKTAPQLTRGSKRED